MNKIIRTAIIGLGNWGPKLLRNLANHPLVEITHLCDHHSHNLEAAALLAPKAELHSSPEPIFSSSPPELVFIASPARTHFGLAKTALLNGLHVFIEKPPTLLAAEALELHEIALAKRRKVFVGHIYMYSNSYLAFKEHWASQFKTQPFLYESIRSDYGRFPSDAGILEHLLYHDLYLLDDLFGLSNLELNHFEQGKLVSPYFSDYASLFFQGVGGKHFQLRASMVAPSKTRLIRIASQTGILEWDDTVDCGRVSYYDYRVSRDGAGKLACLKSEPRLLFPELKSAKGAVEALKNQVDSVVKCILDDEAPLSGLPQAINVLNMIEGIKKSERS